MLRVVEWAGHDGEGNTVAGTVPVEVGPVSGHRVIDQTLVIPAGVVLEIDPDADTHLEFTAGSLVLLPGSTLRMRPSSAQVDHLVSFTGIDESKCVGGGMVPLPETDRGLWVVGDGLLDLAGAERTPWRRAIRSLAIGAVAVELDGDVTGWLPGDELVITPTAAPSVTAHWTLYDYPRVASVEGRVVHLDRPLAYGHPVYVCADGRMLGAEVMNLTRNVRVEGTSGGRAHVFIAPEVDEHGHHGHTTGRQTMSHVAIRWMGPRQPTGEEYTSGGKRIPITEVVLGRYAYHAHHCGDGSRGSLLTGVVVRDSSHAFVPHLSNGIRFEDCLAHNVMDDPFWWDQRPPTGEPQPPSHGVEWRRCGASLVTVDPSFRGSRLSAYNLGNGDVSVCSGSFAVGVQGNVQASGFLWPEGATSVWQFDGQDGLNVSHNNKRDGIFTWQNTLNLHKVRGFVCYRNGVAGVEHGAYVNPYEYEGGECGDNGRAPFLLHSQSHDAGPQILRNLVLNASGRPHALEMAKHTKPNSIPTEVRACRMVGHTVAALGFTYTGANGPSVPELLDVYDDCAWDGLLLDEAQFALMLPGSRVRLMSATTGEVLQTWTV
jgi:hypothetical protein